MKRVKITTILVLAAAALMVWSGPAWAQSPVNGDTHLQSGSNASVNFGAVGNMLVGPGTGAVQNRGLIRFDLSAYSGLLATDIRKAVLWIYVNRITTAGAIDVYDVTTNWGEDTATWNAPPAAGAIQGTIPVSTARQWVGLDVTTLVHSWITTPSSNNGVMLQVFTAPTTSVSLDAKENTSTGHQPQVQIIVK